MLSAYITHPSSLLHEMGPDHPEGPERVSAINDHLLTHGLLDFMQSYAAPAATRAQLERVHTSLYIAELIAGAPAPKGLKTIGRWHAAGSSRGFHLVEGSEAALAEINAEWADLLELEVVPVVEDDVAGVVAKKVYGKK